MRRTPDGRPTTAFPLDLAAAAVLAALGLLVALLRSDPWRLVLGWPLPLLLPGYALLAWLYPAGRNQGTLRRSLGMAERLGLAVVASIATTAVLGMAFNLVGGITLATMAYGLALTTALFLVLAVDARRRIAPGDRPQFTWGQAPDPAAPAGRTGPGMAALLAVSFAGLILVVVLLKPYAPHQDAYSSLYLLGEDGRAACLPTNYTADKGFTAPQAFRYLQCPPSPHVTVGIVNHEGRVATYYVKVFWSEATADPKQALPAASIETFSTQIGPIDPLGSKPTFERQYEHSVALTPPPLQAPLQRVNVWVFKDFGQGIQAEPDLYATLYIHTP